MDKISRGIFFGFKSSLSQPKCFKLHQFRKFSSSSDVINRKITPGYVFKRSFQVITLTLVAGTTYFYYTNEGFSRGTKFYASAMPKFIHYKYVENKTKDKSDEEIDAAFKVLHEKYSPEAEKVALDLRGYYLKSAQMVSTMDSFVPEPYLTWCKKVQNEVPTELSSEVARKVIETSLGSSLEDIFEEFDFDPVGVATIGQVYRAKLKQPYKDEITGILIEEVAVKVQSPNIESRFRADISIIKSFCSFAMPHFIQPLDEIEKQFKTEFDFKLEAQNLQTVHANIMPFYGDKVKIPLPVKPYCTKDVLVMEFLKGDKFLKAIKENFTKAAKFAGKTYEELEKEQIEKIKRGEFQSIEEKLKETKEQQRLLNTHSYFQNTLSAVYNSTIGLLFGSKKSYVDSFSLINLAEIIETVALVHGHEIMVDGCVNGDPHPGNILLLDDGRLGLVDYGQVKHLSKEFRKSYAELIIALAEDDREKVIDVAFNQMKILTKHGNVDTAFRAMKFWNDSNTESVLQGLNAYQFLEFLENEDPVLEQNEDLIIPSRVSLILRGMGNAFGMDLSMAKLWKPIAQQVLKEKN